MMQRHLAAMRRLAPGELVAAEDEDSLWKGRVLRPTDRERQDEEAHDYARRAGFRRMPRLRRPYRTSR